MENKWKEWLEKLNGREKLPKKNQILILLLAGILLLVIVFTTISLPPVESPDFPLIFRKIIPGVETSRKKQDTESYEIVNKCPD